MHATITNAQMLAAARRRLAQHLATRPATPVESAEIHADLDATAMALDAMSRDMSRDIRDRMMIANDAGKVQMYADAWDGDAAEAWERTKSDLEARVAHYASLSQ